MINLSKRAIVSVAFIASVLIFTQAALAQDPSKQATPPGKLQSCQVREQAVKNRMTHLIALATNMGKNFDRHASSVEKYYTTKLVPKGKTVANYDGLVSDITAKKADVDKALAKAQADVASFSCTTSDPKALLRQFRQDMQLTKKALKAYRTSIKNLIVVVHTAAGGKMEGTESGKMKENK